LALAKEHDRAARATAARAVELFDAYVRAPIREESRSDAEAAARLVEAFRTLLPATTRLVAHHFQRVLLATAQARFEGPPIPEEAPRSLTPSSAARNRRLGGRVGRGRPGVPPPTAR